MKYIVVLLLLNSFMWGEGKLPLPKIKGNIAECVYSSIYPSLGKIQGEYNLVNGIDHIDVLRDSFGKISKCTITDSKFGNANLGWVVNPKTGIKDIQQMSDEWIVQNLEKLNSKDLSKSNFDQKTKNKIIKARNNGEYKRLIGLVKSGVCKKRVFNLKFHDDGSVNTGYHEVHNDGKGKVKTTPVTKDKYANRFINPNKFKNMDAGDKKLLEKVHDCTAKTVCAKGDIQCINIAKGQLAKNPKSINSIMAKSSSTVLPKTLPNKSNVHTKATKTSKIKPSSTKVGKGINKIGKKVKNIGKIAAKAARRSSTYTLMKSMGKPIGKTAMRMSMSALKAIPIIGVFAQVAWDMHISNELDKHDRQISQNSNAIITNAEDINNNRNEIMYNRSLIQRLEEEYSILGDAINGNRLQISQLAGGLVETNYKVAGLSSEINIVASNLAIVSEVVEKNTKEIEKLKNNFFVNGAESLAKYYQTNNGTFLDNAIGDFQYYKNISIGNKEIEALARQYYIITLSENYIYQAKHNLVGWKKKKNRNIIIDEFNQLMKVVPRRYEFLSIVMNSYISMLDILTKDEREHTKPKLKVFYKQVVNDLVEQKKFDTAVYVGENYAKLTEDLALYKNAVDERKKNYDVIKNKLTYKNAEEIVDKNENTLLVTLAVKKLIGEDDRKTALNIAQQKFIADETFRYKAYLKLYYELGQDEKYRRLRKLIRENKTYSNKLKMIVKEEK